MNEDGRREPPNPERSPKPSSKKTNDPRRALGREGETRAAAWLEARGYRIEARNVRLGGVEIDLVARIGRTLVFVEVKTRRSARFGTPFDAIDANKRARMQRAAQAWFAEGRGHAARVRFDVIACLAGRTGDAQAWQIEHRPAAFDASD